MNNQLEGTLVMDGLLEGRLPELPDTREKIEQWCSFSRETGVPFRVRFDGERFSVMPETEPVEVDDLGGDVEETIRQLLDQLAKIFPDGERTSLFSTVRSREYRPGQEVQTLYFMNAEGHIDCRGRTVDAETVARRQPMTRREIVRLAVGVLVTALVLFGLSALVVDYGELWRRAKMRVTPLDTTKVELNQETFAEFLAIDKIERSGTTELTLTLKRTDAFPRTDLQLHQLLEDPSSSWQRRMVVQSIAKGYLLLEVFDREDTFRGSLRIRIADLREKETVTTKVPWQGVPPNRLTLIPL